MSIFKKYEVDNNKINSENYEPSYSSQKYNRFRNAIKVENYGNIDRWMKLKEDLIAGKIEEKDINKKDLDGVTRLLKEELAENQSKIKNLETQIAQFKKNN